MQEFSPIRFVRPAIQIVDQTRLPHEEVLLDLRSLDSIVEAIALLRIRGAPLLGVIGAGAMAVAGETVGTHEEALRTAAQTIGAVRPTAGELATAAAAAVDYGCNGFEAGAPRLAALWRFAEEYLARRIREDSQLGAFGASLLPSRAAVLTHCNTGALATGGIGSALGIVRTAWTQGRLSRCYATETRPLLQGARLTAWELKRARIPATLLPDTAAASLLASGAVQAVITGADRIAANGDSANKIGTYGLALAASRHHVPFYIAAPRTTFDPSCPDGSAIPIEFRNSSEVGGFGGTRWAPAGLDAYNPAFDVTPADLISAIVTDAGCAFPPFNQSIAELLRAP